MAVQECADSRVSTGVPVSGALGNAQVVGSIPTCGSVLQRYVSQCFWGLEHPEGTATLIDFGTLRGLRCLTTGVSQPVRGPVKTQSHLDLSRGPWLCARRQRSLRRARPRSRHAR